MTVQGWKYYNHAAVPTTAPHEIPDLTPVKDQTIWKTDGAPLLARWTTDFDCGHETNWWYVIKDEPFDLAALKAKRRYEINKGKKYFEVKRIDPKECKEALFEVQVAAFSGWDEKYRPTVDHDSFLAEIDSWHHYLVYGAYFRENGKLCGYAFLKPYKAWMDFSVLRTDPAYESYAVNAAIVDFILEDQRDFLQSGYICDGSRSINHETAFQDYLEKYFGFRKAYCRLHVKYKGILGLGIRLAFPFRDFFKRFDSISAVHQINGLLQMESVVRSMR